MSISVLKVKQNAKFLPQRFHRILFCRSARRLVCRTSLTSWTQWFHRELHKACLVSCLFDIYCTNNDAAWSCLTDPLCAHWSSELEEREILTGWKTDQEEIFSFDEQMRHEELSQIWRIQNISLWTFEVLIQASGMKRPSVWHLMYLCKKLIKLTSDQENLSFNYDQ